MSLAAALVVLAAPTPSPSPTPAPGAGFNSTPVAIPGVDKLQAIIGYSAWIATAVCLIGLIIAGASMAVAHHHGETVQLGRLGGVVAGCLVVGASSSVVGAILGFNLFTANPEAVPGLTKVQDVIGYVSWAAAAVCLIGLIVAGAAMAVANQQGRMPAGQLGAVAAGCMIVGAAGTIVGALI